MACGCNKNKSSGGGCTGPNCKKQTSTITRLTTSNKKIKINNDKQLKVNGNKGQ